MVKTQMANRWTFFWLSQLVKMIMISTEKRWLISLIDFACCIYLSMQHIDPISGLRIFYKYQSDLARSDVALWIVGRNFVLADAAFSYLLNITLKC